MTKTNIEYILDPRKKLLSPSEAVAYLNFHLGHTYNIRFIYDLIKEGKIQSTKKGKIHLINKSSVDEYFNIS